MAGIANVNVTLVDSPASELVHAGWRFQYCPETRVVWAEHPLGGKQTLLYIERIYRSAFDRDRIGNRIAEFLNTTISGFAAEIERLRDELTELREKAAKWDETQRIWGTKE